MKPPSFGYCAPHELAQALLLLDQHGPEARLLAGGQSLMPLLNLRLVRPAVLIDLNHLDELSGCQLAQDSLVIGAMARQAVLTSDGVRRNQPLLAAAADLIGNFQVRNRGTVGGSLALANPAGELPAAAVALDAELVAVSAATPPRTIGAQAFFLGSQRTALAPTEILTGARFPVLPPRTGWSIQEIAQRQSGVALAGVVALITLDAAGRCAAARCVTFAVQDAPARVSTVEQFLVGQEIIPAAVDSLAAAAAALIAEALRTAPTCADAHATADYRREVTAVLARRGLAEAMQRAIQGEIGG